jgi:hypothetical protein
VTKTVTQNIPSELWNMYIGCLTPSYEWPYKTDATNSYFVRKRYPFKVPHMQGLSIEGFKYGIS